MERNNNRRTRVKRNSPVIKKKKGYKTPVSKNKKMNVSRNNNNKSISRRSATEAEVRARRKARAMRIEKADARRETRRKFSQGKYLIYIVFILIIIYFIGYGIMFISRGSVVFETVQYGSIDEPNTIRGVIVRDETLYKANATGAVVYSVSDKEKVKNGAEICSVRDENAVKALEDELNDINESIFDMQENRDELSLFYEDVKKINLQIKDIVDENIYKFSMNDASAVSNFKSLVQKKIEARNQMLLSENRGSLTELVQKKKNQEQIISNSVSSISAQSGGVVSYYTDGLEETINVNTLGKITKEQTTMDTENFDIKTNVSPNDRIFKIVNSEEWYVAAYIPNSYIEGWQVNDPVNIYVDTTDDDGKIDATVYKLDAGDDQSYVVLKISKDMLDYIDKRIIDFEVSRSDVGFKIPLTSVVDKTTLKIPKQYVKDDMIIKVNEDNGSTETISIENAGGDTDGKYVYTPEKDGIIKLGDVVQNPDSLDDKYTVKEVINTKGVYIVNSGLAQFKTINTDDSSENSTYIIINPEKNPQIRLFDRVLTDTENVEEEQKLYS